MDNRAPKGPRHDTLDVYRAETIIYCGYPMRRGFALLLEGELSRNIDRLIEIGNQPVVTDEVPLPDSHARAAIYRHAEDEVRGQYFFVDLDGGSPAAP